MNRIFRLVEHGFCFGFMFMIAIIMDVLIHGLSLLVGQEELYTSIISYICIIICVVLALGIGIVAKIWSGMCGMLIGAAVVYRSAGMYSLHQILGFAIISLAIIKIGRFRIFLFLL